MSSLLGMLPSVLMIVAPILIAALGGMISERSGVVNIALEGLMGIGAFAAATTHVLLESSMRGSVWLALLVATAAGMAFSLIHAYASVSLKADQTVSGTGINLLSMGGTVFLCQIIFRQERTEPYKLGMMPGLGGIYPTAYIALAVLLATWYVLYKRPFGLRLRACGEHPAAAASAGIDVKKMRYIAVLASGAYAGLAGGCLVLTQTIQFTNMTINGAGFIALAAVSFGRYLPKGIAGSSVLFGSAVALAIYMVNIEALRGLPPEFFSIMPYLITLVTLVAFSGKDYAPRASGQPYEKGGS
ncbi:MAG TPA: ABC transporter permease [Spirochaetia bacterium]|nr:ABC transporter permease [Spirochaetales bacterium]HRY73417.1 ABC transporter permease [Spirochaetia bacterium]